MKALIILAALVATGALCRYIWLRGAPWREYFAEHIEPLRTELSARESERSDLKRLRDEAKANADLYTRDFKAEVRRHQRNKSNAYERLDPLRSRKAELHEQMDEIRARISSWHRSSKGFFGGKGRKIKQDSILGRIGLEQTVQQKEGLEELRFSVSAEIMDIKAKIAEIYEREIEPAKAGIKAAFDDQKVLARFRDAGLSMHHFRNDVAFHESKIHILDSRIFALKELIRTKTEEFKRPK